LAVASRQLAPEVHHFWCMLGARFNYHYTDVVWNVCLYVFLWFSAFTICWTGKNHISSWSLGLILFCLQTDLMNWLDTMQFKDAAMKRAEMHHKRCYQWNGAGLLESNGQRCTTNNVNTKYLEYIHPPAPRHVDAPQLDQFYSTARI
jgi:hypothetical protein